MTTALILFNIGTLLFAMVMVRQFHILAQAQERDPMLKGKLFFFLFNLFNILTTITLLCAFYWRDEELLTPAMSFYFISAMIAVWTYYHTQKRKPPEP